MSRRLKKKSSGRRSARFHPTIDIVETDAIQGTGMRYLMQAVTSTPEINDAKTIKLRGISPLGVCTICAGKQEIGWQNHCGVVRKLNSTEAIFRGD